MGEEHFKGCLTWKFRIKCLKSNFVVISDCTFFVEILILQGRCYVSHVPFEQKFIECQWVVGTIPCPTGRVLEQDKVELQFSWQS